MQNAILYGRDKVVTLAEFHAAFMAKELQKGATRRAESQPKSLNTKKFSNKKFKKKNGDSKVEALESTRLGVAIGVRSLGS